MTMIRYLMYKHKLNNIADRQLSRIAPNSIQNNPPLKPGWHKDAMTWLNHQS